MISPKVLGVLAGRDLAPGALEAWLAWADQVVAADGGADLCRAAGREPDVIVGDLDSITDPTGLTPDPDQDSSDADKLLAHFASQGLSSVTLIGVEGDRLDHVLATLYSCARSKIENHQIVLRQGLCFVRKAGFVDWWPCQGRVSLIPLGPSRITLTGVRWPLHDQILEPLGLVSLSNEVQGLAEGYEAPGVALTIHEGIAALFIRPTL